MTAMKCTAPHLCEIVESVLQHLHCEHKGLLGQHLAICITQVLPVPQQRAQMQLAAKSKRQDIERKTRKSQHNNFKT